MEFAPQQVQAIDLVATWLKDTSEDAKQTFYLGGFAGTGKTTIAKHLASLCDGPSAFMAYTGKAASVLTKKGCPATTIHSMIYKVLPPDRKKLEELKKELDKTPGDEKLSQEIRDLSRPRFELNHESEIRNLDLIIVDEVSMVDQKMGEDLLSFGIKVLVLGDPGQLPPVGGQGYFTRGKPDFTLTEIHRQAADSPIIQMATIVRQGHRLSLGKRGESNVIQKFKMDLFAPYDQIIVGMNKTRSMVNDKLRTGSPALPVAGEKVICLRNNSELGILNGTQWTVKEAKDKGFAIDISIYDVDNKAPEDKDIKIVPCHPFDANLRDMMPWEKMRLNEFDYGYGITCHKSQGSQWDDLLVINESWAFREDSTKWLYTAITRAAERITVVM